MALLEAQVAVLVLYAFEEILQTIRFCKPLDFVFGLEDGNKKEYDTYLNTGILDIGAVT